MIPAPKQLDPFCAASLNLFHERVQSLVQNELKVAPETARAFTTTVTADLRQSGKRYVGGLKFNEIRTRWNSVLAAERSAAIADWIAPHVDGEVLDLLCGDGRVGESLLERHRVDVTLTERAGAYVRDRNEHRLPYYSFDTFTSLSPQPRFDVVLLCTVLHHEPNPESLLALSVQLARRKIVILENCLETECPADYHLLIDLFFNQWLNPIEIDCPANHRTPEGWLSMISRYGRTVFFERKGKLPGIPLPHYLFVIDC
jgi:2-polyprenyl-3-methyl-5-hydroxy-6-metoxy-1,4-benzoquinol methylase